LIAVADENDSLAFDGTERGILLVVDFGGHVELLSIRFDYVSEFRGKQADLEKEERAKQVVPRPFKQHWQLEKEGDLNRSIS
jgi:hypothetical protein